MIDLSTALLHYKRPEIQEEMVLHAQNKEIAIKYGENGFGKRPDTLKYKADVLELVKQGATSFHSSEEIWQNPLQIAIGMKKSEIEKLRIGFDLVLDIDCPYIEYSKIAADLLVKALNHHGIKNISVKFSGNKGFHIGVPFESFPKQIKITDFVETKNYFPDGVRIIANYLSDMIMEPLSKKILKIEGSIEKIKEKTGKSFEELTITKQNSYGDKFIAFNAGSILVIDTVLISSRHLYRMPYSLHEKSGLASIPVDPDKILEFKKQHADPKNLVVNKNLRFIDREKSVSNEASELFDKAIYSHLIKQKKQEIKTIFDDAKKYEDITQAIPKDFFPPCIKKGLKGLEDGKKRFIFCAVNFLTSIAWSYDDIEKLLKEWNKKNKEPLRDVLILGQIRYHKQQKKKVLPPNCANKMYYVDMQICNPDNLCQKIKNPVQYSKRKTMFLNKNKNKITKKEQSTKNQDF
jgi:hypothetical protein